MHIQSEILCVPGQLLHHGELDSGSSWDEIFYGKDCGQRYSLSRCSLREQRQLEWSCLGKELDSLCNLIHSYPVNFILHGQLAMVRLCLEFLTPAENLLHLFFSNIPIRFYHSKLFGRVGSGGGSCFSVVVVC